MECGPTTSDGAEAEPARENAAVAQLTRNVRGVSLCTILSRILGLLRDGMMAASFGNGPLLDAFTVAFRLPNLARALLGEGALATAFLPAYVAEREQNGNEAARRLAVAVILALAATTGLLVGVLELLLWCAPQFITFSTEADLLRRLLIWLLPYLPLICLSAQLAAILNAEQKFLVAALIPSALNVCWLLGLGLVSWWTDSEERLFGMSAAVLFGGIAQVILPLLALRQMGFRWTTQWRSALPILQAIFWQMAPIVGGLLITQINAFSDSLIAWIFAAGPHDDPAKFPLSSGTASALYFGQRLYQFPLGVFGVALGTVLYPQLTRHAQSKNYAALRDDLTRGMRYVMAIGFPASAGLMLLSRPLASACFEYGAFSSADARTTAGMIAAYGSGVWAYCGLLILQRGFFALGNRHTPLRLALIAVVANIATSLSAIWWFGELALPSTTALVSMGQAVGALILLQHHVGSWNFRTLAGGAALAGICTLIMTVAGMGSLLSLELFYPNSGRMLRLGLPFLVAVGAYLLAARLLSYQDPFELLNPRTRRAMPEI